jgi:glutathione peroxidase
MLMAMFGSTGAGAQSMPEQLTLLSGESFDTSAWKGKVVLFVNVASRCGFTPQYDALQGLWTENKEKGLVVVGVPCNQFGAQESGSSVQIQSFCRINFGVDFPLLDKQAVNGSDRSPLYDYLLKGRTPVLWNFEKVLVGRDGKVIDRFRSTTEPSGKKILKAIEKALGA